MLDDNTKKRPGATKLTEAQAAALKAAPEGIWAKFGSSNFIVSVLMLLFGLWAGNSEALVKAGAGTIIQVGAFIHAARLFIITAKFDPKKWALNSNTWAALLSIVGTFFAIPPDVASGINDLGKAVESGNFFSMLQPLLYLVNILWQFLRREKVPAAVITTALAFFIFANTAQSQTVLRFVPDSCEESGGRWVPAQDTCAEMIALGSGREYILNTVPGNGITTADIKPSDCLFFTTADAMPPVNIARESWRITDARADMASDTADLENYCKVVRIVDGDTYDLLTTAGKIRARLIAADCPEVIGYTQPQPYGRAATDSVRALLLGRYVRFHVYGTDIYARTVVRLWIGEKDVSALLIESGLAWYYPRPRNAKSQARLTRGEISALTKAQRAAQKQKRGLWAGYAGEGGVNVPPVSPGEWRKTKKRG